MCNPAAAVAVVGLLVTIQTNNNQTKYNEAVTRNNAITAEYQAADAIERGTVEEKQQRLKIEQLKGQQRAAIAGSGFTLSEGSASNVLEDTAALGEEDVFRIRSNAAREAWAYRVQASNARSEGGLISMAGQNRNTQSVLEASGTVADSWYKYNRDKSGAYTRR